MMDHLQDACQQSEQDGQQDQVNGQNDYLPDHH